MSGKRKYRVDIECPHYYSVEVEAVNEEEAKKIGWQEFSDGNAADDDEGDATLTGVEEID